MSSRSEIKISEEDLQEIFSLFSSPAVEEKDQVYEESSPHYLRNVNLNEEYSLVQEKREFAIDAWRAVAYFFFRHGYTLSKGGVTYDLAHSAGYEPEGREKTTG